MFSHLEDLDDDDDDFSVDCLFDAGKKPLLDSSDSEAEQRCKDTEEALRKPLAAAQQQRKGLRWLLGKPPRKKGTCPLCNEVIRSGAHNCFRAERALEAGLRSDSERKRGNELFRAGQYPEAISAYSAALVDVPGEAKLLSNRAAAYLAHGDHASALADADKAVEVAPAWEKGYYRRASILEAQQDWVAAAEVYKLLLRNCVARDPQLHRQAKQSLARARARAACASLPEAFCKEVLWQRWEQPKKDGAEVEKDLSICNERLAFAEKQKEAGNAKVGQQEWPTAFACYQIGLDLLKFTPAEPLEAQSRLEVALWLNQALCLAHLSQPCEAAALCKQALDLDARNVKARFRRASALGELEEYSEALSEVFLALALQPDDPELRHVHMRLSKKRLALERRQQLQCARMLGAEPSPSRCASEPYVSRPRTRGVAI